MLNLSICHSIFLKKEEIEKLLNEETVKTTGVCLPIWSFKKSTSEPGEEVFCEYEISNSEEKPIEIYKNKYKIYLPDYCRKITRIIRNKKEYKSLSEEEKELCVKRNNQILLIKKPNLFEEDDNEIIYNEYQKIKKDDSIKIIRHLVALKTMKTLFASFN